LADFNGQLFSYILLQPFLRLLTKSPTSAIQTVLHALFLPTPFKVLAQATEEATKTKPTDVDTPREVLKPGALYSECAVVNLRIPTPPDPLAEKESEKTGKGKKKKKEEEVAEIPDDGEFGGEVMGRLVWEAYETALKEWEKANPAPKEEHGPTNDSTDTTTSS
jgi:hypothetical protein